MIKSDQIANSIYESVNTLSNIENLTFYDVRFIAHSIENGLLKRKSLSQIPFGDIKIGDRVQGITSKGTVTRKQIIPYCSRADNVIVTITAEGETSEHVPYRGSDDNEIYIEWDNPESKKNNSYSLHFELKHVYFIESENYDALHKPIFNG